jgi:hypothetical protein
MRCRRPPQPSDNGLGLRIWLQYLALALFLVLSLPAGAGAESMSDLRGVNIGMSVQDLPPSGYHNVWCIGAPKQQLESWRDWTSCTANADGLHGLHVEYDQPGQDTTMVAGHPVDLSVYFDGSARVARIEIKTQDHTSLYMRKKAYRLGHQAMEHYGEDGWTCENAQPGADEEPIGPIYVNDTCTKSVDQRTIQLKSRFFHKNGGAPGDFVSESLVVISLRPSEPK